MHILQRGLMALLIGSACTLSLASVPDAGFSMTSTGSSFYQDGTTTALTNGVANVDVRVNQGEYSYSELRYEETAAYKRTWRDTTTVAYTNYDDWAEISTDISASSFSSRVAYAKMDGVLTAATSGGLAGNSYYGVSISLSGLYNPTSVGNLEVLPGMPSLYYSIDGGKSYSSLGTNNYTDPYTHSFTTYGGFYLDLSGVSLQSFSVIAVGGGGLQFSSMQLYSSVMYSTSTSSTSSKLLSEVLTAPIPEPESYALFMAGLLALGVVRRRSRA